MHLTHVSLRRCHLLTDHSIAALARNSINLESLDIRGLYQVSDIGVGEFVNCKKLEMLFLECKRISDKSIRKLLKKNGHQFHTLHFNACFKFSETFIASIVEYSKNLHQLALHWCRCFILDLNSYISASLMINSPCCLLFLFKSFH